MASEMSEYEAKLMTVVYSDMKLCLTGYCEEECLVIARSVERVVLEHSPEVKAMRERIEKLRSQFMQSCDANCPCKMKEEEVFCQCCYFPPSECMCGPTCHAGGFAGLPHEHQPKGITPEDQSAGPGMPGACTL